MKLILTVITALLLAHAAHAQTVTFAQDYVAPPSPSTYPVPAVRICEGQSWATNYFSGMNQHGFNPLNGIYVTLATTNGNFPTGIEPISAGINLILPMTGLTTISEPADAYPVPGASSDTGDALSACRSSVLAQEWLRYTASKPLAPILEFNVSCPASSWISGTCGGLSNNAASFTGVIATTTLTVSGFSGATIQVGMRVSWSGGPAEDTILAYGTNGTTGTGGNGTYALSVSQSASSQAMTAMGQSWISLQAITPVIAASLPNKALRLATATYKDVSWIQGGSFDTSSPTPTITEWTAMMAANDALNLPGAGTTGMLYVFSIRTGVSSDTALTNAEVGAWQIVRANANGRTIGACPMYPWPFDGVDNIHLGDYGTIRMGECEGLALYITEDEGVFFKPLWRSLTLPLVVSGTTITVPFDRPTGTEFASGQMAWMSTANDGIKVWPQYGFHVMRSGVEQPLCNGTPTISGLNVILDICETPQSGDEVSYAYYGPGGPSPGPNSGVGGNLMMAGPPSTLFPGVTINSWAWPYKENLP